MHSRLLDEEVLPCRCRKGPAVPTEHVETLVIGGGQAGLAMSYHLGQHMSMNRCRRSPAAATRWSSPSAGIGPADRRNVDRPRQGVAGLGGGEAIFANP